MISVGVDIMTGLNDDYWTAKNTSEYIQSSSRVGKARFSLYPFNHTRSRDRSHFETFKAYHQAMYKYVEPTSITPFSFKARKELFLG